jgi:hypothetical protein
MKTVLFILLLAAPVFAQGVKEGREIEAWTFVSEGPLVRSHFAPDTIRRNGEIIKVWMRFELPQGSRKLYADTPIEFGEVRVYGLLNCARNEMQAKTMIAYDQNGSYFASKQNVSGWTEDKPNTISHSVFAYFCEQAAPIPAHRPTLKP